MVGWLVGYYYTGVLCDEAWLLTSGAGVSLSSVDVEGAKKWRSTVCIMDTLGVMMMIDKVLLFTVCFFSLSLLSV